jgi:hypothetical protein
MMKKCLCSLHLLLLGALVAYLGLDGRRTHDRQLCELDPLVGRPHANAEPDYASSLGARSAQEERDLRIIVGSLAGGLLAFAYLLSTRSASGACRSRSSSRS